MNRKVLGFAAALLMAVGCMTACNGREAAPEETTVRVIETTAADTVQDESAEGTDVTTAADTDTPMTIPTEVSEVEALVTDDQGQAVTDDAGNYVTEIVSVDVPVVTTAAPKDPILKEYNVDCTTRYGYGQLSASEQELYKQMLDAAKNIKTRIQVPDDLSDETWVKVYGCMYMQEPELFWLSSSKVQKGRLWYWEVDNDLIASMQKEIDQKAGEVLALADGKSTYEKVKTFHDWIVLNNTFNKEPGYNQTIYGGFVQGTVQCEGYAKTMQYLCDLSDIESMIVVGTNADGSSHAWNVIKIDGDWYNVDCTWDDPILSTVIANNLRHRYFGVTDAQIHNKSHYNINKKTTGTQVTYFTPPACTATKYNYFDAEGLVYSDKASAETALKNAMKTTAANKTRVAEIKVSDKSVYDAVTAELKTYASWIKGENSAVKSVKDNSDPETLVIEIDLEY